MNMERMIKLKTKLFIGFIVLAIIVNTIFWIALINKHSQDYVPLNEITSSGKCDPIPTPTKTNKTVEKIYLNAERYTICMETNLIDYMNKPLDEVINYINTTFEDKLKLIDSVTVSSAQDNYFINQYESKDKSILILYTDNNICVAYDWQKKED